MLLCQTAAGEDHIQIYLNKSGAQGEVGIHSQMSLPVSAMVPEYVVQQSSNMVDWTTVAGPLNGSMGVSDEFLRVQVPATGPHLFYRAVANVKLAPAAGGIGEAVFGYGTAFGKEIRELGQISLQDFISAYPVTNQCLPQITFDPTTGEFWDLFNLDPALWNATNSSQTARWYDFRLNPAELAVFRTNGFVVSQRMERRTMVDAYYDLYTDDLPVFITTDSILQAWQRTIVTMLAEIEETCFHLTLSNIVTSMSAQVPALWAQGSSTAMADGILDADYFLAVAKSLIHGNTNYGSLGQIARINTTLAAINAKMPDAINLYGETRMLDFSQFTVRSHYANSEQLKRYFRAMIWCGLADFRYAGFSDGVTPGGNTLRELSGAVALELLLRNSGRMTAWSNFNRALEMLVGVPDSLTFAQLNGLLVAEGIHSPADLSTTDDLLELQRKLMSGELGMQQITSGYYFSPFGPGQVKLPLSFCFMGQRFVIDSWAFSKTTFDNIIWDENGFPEFEDKVLRRVPSALDVAFSVFGNNQVVPEIAARIARTDLTPADGRAYWRDGLWYQHNLAAVRNVIDSQSAGAWTNTVYNHWLACLRLLSKPTTGGQFPEVMRTRAWAMKTLNTQLASWTHLRHTTALYVKESYTPGVLCMYPKGYVEPRPDFWARFGEMAAATKKVLQTLPTSGVFYYTRYTNNWIGQPEPYVAAIPGIEIHTNRLAMMDRFITTLQTLRSLSEKELSRTPFSAEDDLFLQRMVEFSYFNVRSYSGWYPRLYYLAANAPDTGEDKASSFWDPLATTVHTDMPAPLVGDPGSILHQAVGNVHLMLIAVDSGSGDVAVYGAPVLSHYEFEENAETRLTDAEWKDRVTVNTIPPAPEWTRTFLVPK
jgi:hypothetical protein